MPPSRRTLKNLRWRWAAASTVWSSAEALVSCQHNATLTECPAASPPSYCPHPTRCCLAQPEEALRSAVEEFSAQGVDLGNIIKTLAGGDISAHPATLAVQRLQAAAEAGDARGAAAAADDVAATVSGAGSTDKAAEAATVLHKAGAAQALVRAAGVCSGAPADLLPVLRALAVVLGGSRELQSGFLQARGVAALQQALASHGSDAGLVAAALQAATAAATKSEEGKAALMAADISAASLEALRRHGDSPEALQAACSVLCTLTNPDDDSVPASRWAAWRLAPLPPAVPPPACASAAMAAPRRPALPPVAIQQHCIRHLPAHAGHSPTRASLQRRAPPPSWWPRCAATPRCPPTRWLPWRGRSRRWPPTRRSARRWPPRAACSWRWTSCGQVRAASRAGTLVLHRPHLPALALCSGRPRLEVHPGLGVAAGARVPCSTECGASLAPAAGLSDAALARALCSLLRQLASSDSCKQLLVEGGALELLAALLAAHGGSPAVLEQALGMLTNVTLRYPEAAARVRLAGCARWALGQPGTLDQC